MTYFTQITQFIIYSKNSYPFPNQQRAQFKSLGKIRGSYLHGKIMGLPKLNKPRLNWSPDKIIEINLSYILPTITSQKPKTANDDWDKMDDRLDQESKSYLWCFLHQPWRRTEKEDKQSTSEFPFGLEAEHLPSIQVQWIIRKLGFLWSGFGGWLGRWGFVGCHLAPPEGYYPLVQETSPTMQHATSSVWRS